MSETEKPRDIKAEMDGLRAEVEELGVNAHAGDPNALELLHELEKAVEDVQPGETVKETARNFHELGRLREKLDQVAGVREANASEKSTVPHENRWEQQEAERKKCAREDRVLMNELRATEITRNKLLLDIWADEVEMKKESHQAYLKDVKSLTQWRAENTRILNSVALAAQGFVKVVGLLAAAGEKVAKRWSK